MRANDATNEFDGRRDPRWHIRVRGLRKRFSRDGPEVLRGVDLDIERGKVNVIIGGSGQGKSLLVKHFIGLLPASEGHVWVDGVEMRSLRGEALAHFRRRFGMVFQWAAVFDSMTVMDNCMFPLLEQRERKLTVHQMRAIVMARLDALDLRGTQHMYPGELSGGMRKRVGLARALVLEPEILLYDEPTTGLDPIATHNVDRMIMNVAQQFRVTSVVISHDMASVFRIADRIAMIHGGRIIESGVPSAFRATSQEYVRRFVTMSGVSATRVGGLT